MADKTAMQQLIDYLITQKNKIEPMTYGFLMHKAIVLLETERQQIIDTVDDCWTINDKQGYVPSGEQYYSNKYGSQP